MALRAGTANLPLHGGQVPKWLADRMTRLGAVMGEAIVHHYGRDELLRRLAHPFWFQSFAVGAEGTSLSQPSLPHLNLPGHHNVRATDVNARRLYGNLAAAADRAPVDFSDLLLTPVWGPALCKLCPWSPRSCMEPLIVSPTPARFLVRARGKGQASLPRAAPCLRRNDTSAEVCRPEREIRTPGGIGCIETPR